MARTGSPKELGEDGYIYMDIITYVGEEYPGNASPRMHPFLMSLLGITAPTQTPLVTRHRVLIRLDAPVVTLSVVSQPDHLIGDTLQALQQTRTSFPAQGEVRSRDDLDEIHIMIHRVVRELFGFVQGIDMMICPGHGFILPSQLRHHIVFQLRSEPEMVHVMREGMFRVGGRLEVVL